MPRTVLLEPRRIDPDALDLVITALRADQTLILPTAEGYVAAMHDQAPGAVARLREISGDSGSWLLHLTAPPSQSAGGTTSRRMPPIGNKPSRPSERLRAPHAVPDPATGRFDPRVPLDQRIAAAFATVPLAVADPRHGPRVAARYALDPLLVHLLEMAQADPLATPPGLLALPLRTDAGRPVTSGVLARRLVGGRVDLAVDVGLTRGGAGTTIIELAQHAFAVRVRGAVPAEEIVRVAGRHVGFVCTGNICRSASAEVLLDDFVRDDAARRLGDAPPRTVFRALDVTSAGTEAVVGADMPAQSKRAVLRVSPSGVEPRITHVAQQADRDWLTPLDEVYAMDREHIRRLRTSSEGLPLVPELLDPSGSEIADPFGGSDRTHRRVVEQIAESLRRRFFPLPR